MSIFKAAQESANLKEKYDKVISDYKDLDTPEEKLEYLLEAKEWINNNFSVPLMSAFHVRGKNLNHWIAEEIELQKERIKTREYLPNTSNTKKQRQKKILPKECLAKIKELAEKHSAKGSDWIYEEAYKCKECQYEIVDEDRKEIGSWSTLRRRVRKHYPELHNRLIG